MKSFFSYISKLFIKKDVGGQAATKTTVTEPGSAADQKKPGPKRAPGIIKKKPAGTPQGRQTKKRKPWTQDQFVVEPSEDKIRFHDLGLPRGLMHAISDLDFRYCMPVQAESLPHTLKGRDAMARAQTGTGKSAAFLVTIIASLIKKPIKGKRIKGMPRAMIIAPTRELVLQIEKDARALTRYTHLRTVAVFGGMGYKKQQIMLQQKPVDIMAATPGRLIDFMQQKLVKPAKVEILVVDEADRMLDMGFLPDIRKIVYGTPRKTERQTLFFSATLSPEILRIASQWTKDPVTVEIDPDKAAADSVNQKIYIVTEAEKFILLYNLVSGENLERVLLFVNRRDTTRKLAAKLQQYGLECDILSGEVSQRQRVRTLENFRAGKVRIMVATDVAARGLHIEGISHVINYDLPQDPEHYVHRIGRTGRAGAEGISVSFADEMSSFFIPDIEAVLGNSLACEYPSEELLKILPKPKKKIKVLPGKEKKRFHSRSRGKKSYSKNRGRRKTGHSSQFQRKGRRPPTGPKKRGPGPSNKK